MDEVRSLKRMQDLVEIIEEVNKENKYEAIDPSVNEIKIIVEGMLEKDEKLEEIVKEVKAKYPDDDLFSIETMYNGYYILRSQDMSDVSEGATRVQTYIDTEIEAKGGPEHLGKLPPAQQEKIYRAIDDSAGDVSNNTILERCVLYPTDIKDKIDNGKINSGLYSLLLDRIAEISEWGNLTVEKI